MRRTSLHLFIAIVIATSAFAQQKRAEKSAPDAERLRAHVTYLASDKTEGRKTGSLGAELAAAYIAEEFARYGLKHPHFDKTQEAKSEVGKQSHGYMQAFPYVAGVELGKNNSMLFTPQAADGAAGGRPAGLDLRVGEDWLPLGWGANARVENLPVTYVGYGISAADLNHDDYAGVDVAGRVVLAFAGTPEGDNPHSQFARYADHHLKAVAARDHGAKALVLIAGEENFRDDKLSRLGYDNAGSEAGLPVVAVSRQVARRALEAAANLTLPLDELQKAAGGARAGGAESPRKNFSGALPNVAFSISTDVVRRARPASNVIGILEGRDPQLKNEAVVIGAHYDHLGRGGHGSLAAREGEIHYGADDNASGTAGLLELARLLSAERATLRRTVVFIAFGGEEEGLLGSNYYVNHAVVPLAQTVAMFNMDMVGRLREDRLHVGGLGTATEWKAWVEQANMGGDAKLASGSGAPHGSGGPDASMAIIGANDQPVANMNVKPRFALTLSEDGFGPSDHSSFYAKKTPVLFFYTGSHEDYHKPSDTADRINYTGLARVLSFVHEIVQTTVASDRRPTYAVAKSEGMRRSTSFRVYLGTVPNYAEGADGLKLDAVRDDSPAAKAGLRAGDVIVKMAGREVRNVYDYTYALSEMKAGQEYEMEVLREGARLQLKITPAARK